MDRGSVSAGAACAVVLGASATLVVLALATARGVTHLGGSSYDTEFANPTWWWAGLGLFVPVGIAAYRHPRFFLAFVAAALVPQAVLPAVDIYRRHQAGWADPMEGFGFFIPVLMLPVFAFAAAGGAMIGEWRQGRRTGAAPNT
ncbi:hypothetical protein ABT214_12900 [Micromonospora purpureochromogenes]|uniref:hypothetical protein n=1 Tax=Micromonospora purpureochromogenes TaxID=47872 RepID=UPI003320A3C3